MDGIDRFWLRSYPAGIPADIDPAEVPTLVELLEQSFAQYADRSAFACMGAELTYRELDALSSAVAAWLQQRGLVPGDRVALMMPNVLQYPVAMAGILRAGCVAVNVNPLYTPRELEHQLIDSGARALFVLENFAHTVAAVRERVPTELLCVCALGDLLGPLRGAVVNFVVRHVRKLVPPYSLPDATAFRDVIRTPQRHAPVAVRRDDIAFLQYTGGTTGVSKAATLRHRNLAANVLQVQAWYRPALQQTPPGEQFTTVAALPLYHIYALTCCALLTLRLGGKCALIPNPRDIPALAKEWQRHRIHCFPAVNTLFNALTNDPGFRALDFSSLRICGGGGMAVQRAVADKWLALTGRPICEGYGLSETSPVAMVNPILSTEFSGCVGLPLPSTDVHPGGRGRRAGAARNARRNRPARSAGDGRLLAAAGGDRPRDAAQRLPAYRRRGRDGCARLHAHRRPQEGHDPGVGVQGIPQRSRGYRRCPSRACANARWSACRTSIRVRR